MDKIILSDNFDRANEVPIVAPWVNDQNTISLLTNAVTGAGVTFDIAHHNGAGLTADTFTRATLITAGASGTTGVTARHSAVALTYYKLYNNATQYEIVKLVAGGDTTLATIATIPLANDVMEVRVIGQTIHGLVNNTVILTATDPSIPNAAQAGLDFPSGAGGIMDDFFAGNITFDNISTNRKFPMLSGV